MINDSSNILTDFDLCLALAQKAINSQMTYAWKAWKRRSKFQDTISIFKTIKNGEIVDAKTGLEVTLAPLSVSLNVPHGKLGQVRVTLHLASGKVTYIDEETGELSNPPYAFKDWSVSFITDLDKGPVDLDILAKIDPDAHQTAKDFIDATGLPDSVFSIEYLFMKFTEVDLLLADNKDIDIPPEVPGDARARALRSLNLLLQGELGNFMLGTVVRHNNTQTAPTFAMTDFIFDVHADAEAADASTLAYLGVFSHRALPADRNAARIKLSDAWVRPGQVDGTGGLISGIMAIRKGVFLDQYLIPQFTKAVGIDPTVRELTWAYSDASSSSNSDDDIIERKYDSGRGFQLDLTVVPGTNQLSLSGKVYSHANYDGYTHGIKEHTEWIHCEGHQNLSGSVTLEDTGIGTSFKVVSKLAYQFDDVKVDNSTVKGFAKVEEAAGWLAKKLHLVGKTWAELLGNQMKGDVNNLKSWMDKQLGAVSIDLGNHAFIPPGGGVFTFQNPRFSNAGDLLFDVIYKAP